MLKPWTSVCATRSMTGSTRLGLLKVRLPRSTSYSLSANTRVPPGSSSTSPKITGRATVPRTVRLTSPWRLATLLRTRNASGPRTARLSWVVDSKLPVSASSSRWR